MFEWLFGKKKKQEPYDEICLTSEAINKVEDFCSAIGERIYDIAEQNVLRNNGLLITTADINKAVEEIFSGIVKDEKLTIGGFDINLHKPEIAVIKAVEIVHARELPETAGKRLAEEAIKRNVNFPLEIDVSNISPAMLISALFLSFYDTIAETAPDQLEASKAIKWRTKHDFQQEHITRWTKEFKKSA